jgi:HD-GYP domain-containing protein (c-di-GMP phosphodiesterase class II)
VELAVEVGTRMGLGAEALRDLEFGSLLHDVGKIAVPNEIINKPGRLTPQEWAIMKRHTIEGQRMLENVGGVLSRVGVIVRASHEAYDGTGDPDGLAGDAIPVQDAIAELRRCSGTQFDPAVVAALVSVIEESRVVAAPLAA